MARLRVAADGRWHTGAGLGIREQGEGSRQVSDVLIMLVAERKA